MGELRDRMEADLRLRNLRPSTQVCYLGCVHKFAAYHMSCLSFIAQFHPTASSRQLS